LSKRYKQMTDEYIAEKEVFEKEYKPLDKN
jgi:hypothetical protein